MSSINSLLNHEPALGQQARAPNCVAPTTYEAADALTTLAGLANAQQYPPTRELPSPTASDHPPRRTSSIGSNAAPVEPEPPGEPQTHSPTLEHYHHGSKSPEEQRRQSLLPRSSPAPVLAPIQSLSHDLQDKMLDDSPALGTDVSQVLSPPLPSVDDAGRDETQTREPAYVRAEPTTSQAIAPESTQSADTTPHPSASTLPSPSPAIKSESQEIAPENIPSTSAAHTSERQHSVTAENVDADTLKAIEIAKQSDLGLRVKRNASVAESVTSPIEPKPVPSKKRPAPASAPAVKKKGTATTKKPASKKRKLDPEGDSNTRSVTPTSRSAKTGRGKKGSQASTPLPGSSPAPDHSSQIHPSDDDADSSDDNAVYCICRKPDNHRWMIGCDGGCEDWFHGSCVNMNQADEDLVDKFICPNCEEQGRGQTTWKPMCRRVDCRRPARLAKGNPSKYCSDECGTLFMQEQLQRTAGAGAHGKRKTKKKGKNGEDAASDDEEPTPLGGVLRAKDLKALVDQSKDIQAFKALGSGVLSPPQTASPTKATFDGTLPNGARRPSDDLALTPGETERLNALHKEKSQLKDRLEVLKDREKFVSMVKVQATRVADREKIKVKEFCGYDSRLAWSDAEFLQWRHTPHGRAAFKFSTLAPTPEQLGSSSDGDNDVPMANAEPEKETICLKKRCPKHPQWQKLNLQDARFEELEIVESIKECERDERSVRERARRRGAKDAMAKEITGGEGGAEERNREGWVEAVS